MLIQTAIQIKAASRNERAAFYAMLDAVAKKPWRTTTPEEVDKAVLSWRRSCDALDYLLDLATEEEQVARVADQVDELADLDLLGD